MLNYDALEIKQCPQYSLDPLKTLQLIRDNKKYNFLGEILKVFQNLGLINKHNPKYDNENIQKICSEIYCDTNFGKDLPINIETYITLKNDVISRVMGRKGLRKNHWRVRVNELEYIIGTIQGEQLELFKESYNEYKQNRHFERNKDSIYDFVGQFGTIDFSDYIGYDDDNIVFLYFWGIYRTGNQGLLNKLSQGTNSQSVLELLSRKTNRDYRVMDHSIPDYCMKFYSWLRQFVIIDEETKEYMRNYNSKVYDILYFEDV
jgi:hypothetical protein